MVDTAFSYIEEHSLIVNLLISSGFFQGKEVICMHEMHIFTLWGRILLCYEEHDYFPSYSKLPVS